MFGLTNNIVGSYCKSGKSMLLVRILRYAFFIAILYLLFIAIAQYMPHTFYKSDWKQAVAPIPADGIDNIFWFVQVSDIHISRYYDLKRGPDFKSFCSNTLNTINPDVVLVTGDLTDAKHKNLFGSEQYQDEWESYKKILQDTKVTEKYVWLDVRGNHDAFNVISLNHPSNYYMHLSGSKGKLTNSTWTLVKSFGNYSFVPVDASIMPGPKRPFNFAGHLSSEAMEKLQLEGERNLNSNMTIWYGHYPTPSISTAAKIGLTNIIGQFGSVYLCGHFHDLGGLFPHLHAMHPNGFLELELADWKWNRKYRLLAVDHDMLSYVDTTLDEWPVVVVTNPKRARDMMPLHEPIGRIAKSTHIRFLAFSPSGITKATVSIDGVEIKERVRHIEGPLWACRWQPELYSTGMHELVVKVEDAAGDSTTWSSRFSLDDHWSVDFDLTATLVLLTDFCSLTKFAFAIITALAIAALLLVKYVGVSLPCNTNLIQLWLFRLQLLLSDDFTFYLLIVFFVNLLLGPLFIGELVSDHTGVCFIYGILVDGHFIKENMIYVHGIGMILFLYLPSIACLSYSAELRWLKKRCFTDTLKSFDMPLLANVLFVGIISLHVRECRALYLSYGSMALLLSPAFLWWTIAVCVMACRVWLGENHKLRKP